MKNRKEIDAVVVIWLCRQTLVCVAGYLHHCLLLQPDWTHKLIHPLFFSALLCFVLASNLTLRCR